MAKGLVGGVNTTVKSFTASTGEDSTYTARVTSVDSSPVEYSGLETDSLKINVDNSNHTISGEVKWIDMIASTEIQEDAYHAYPADKARLKFTKIQNALKELDAALIDLNDACSSSNQKVESYTNKIDTLRNLITDIQTSCSTISNNLSTEVSKRELADVRVEQDCDKKINNLRDELSGKIDIVDASVNSRLIEVSQFSSNLDKEISRAKDEESKLKSSVQTVQTSVKSNTSLINDVKRTLQDASSRLATLELSDVSTITSDNTSRIKDLEEQLYLTKNNISIKYDSLTEQDKKILEVQNKHSSELSAMRADVEQTKYDVKDCKSKTSKNTLDIQQLDSAHSALVKTNTSDHLAIFDRLNTESDTRRALYEYHDSELDRLEVRISDLQTDLIEVIQTLANELRSKDAEIENNLSNISYDFIDAGTAPI